MKTRKLNKEEVKMLETPKIKGKRGRPKGSTKKETLYTYRASDGCIFQSGLTLTSAYCGHDKEYKKIK